MTRVIRVSTDPKYANLARAMGGKQKWETSYRQSKKAIETKI
jgi:hypothetical protein